MLMVVFTRKVYYLRKWYQNLMRITSLDYSFIVKRQTKSPKSLCSHYEVLKDEHSESTLHKRKITFLSEWMKANALPTDKVSLSILASCSVTVLDSSLYTIARLLTPVQVLSQLSSSTDFTLSFFLKSSSECLQPSKSLVFSQPILLALGRGSPSDKMLTFTAWDLSDVC